MFDWIRVDGDTNIDPYVKSHFESTKREIINNTLFFNDIYIKNEVPLCVYYRRCVRLVRSHILMESSVLNQESFKGNNYKLNIDDLSTKNDIYVQIGDKLQSRDSIDISTTYYPSKCSISTHKVKFIFFLRAAATFLGRRSDKCGLI